MVLLNVVDKVFSYAVARVSWLVAMALLC